MHAMLRAKFDVQKSEEVPHLGRCAHRAFTTATRKSLLNGHCRRNAVHRIHFRPACRLNDAACVGIQTFQVSALALVEQDVEGQC